MLAILTTKGIEAAKGITAVRGAAKTADTVEDITDVTKAAGKTNDLLEGAGDVTKYFDDVQLKTEPNKAYFWSGKSNGVGGADTATSIAKKNGGVTLETTLESQGIKIPEFNINDPAAVEAWQRASTTYASQASGGVRSIVGSSINPNGIWNTFELPALMANPNVTKIILIDPKTLVETIIFTR